MYKMNKAQVISNAVCGVLELVAILFFILYGIFTNVWHPTWVVIPCTAIFDGILSIIVSTCIKVSKKDETEENSSKKAEK